MIYFNFFLLCFFRCRMRLFQFPGSGRNFGCSRGGSCRRDGWWKAGGKVGDRWSDGWHLFDERRAFLGPVGGSFRLLVFENPKFYENRIGTQMDSTFPPRFRRTAATDSTEFRLFRPVNLINIQVQAAGSVNLRKCFPRLHRRRFAPRRLLRSKIIFFCSFLIIRCVAANFPSHFRDCF